MKPCGPILVPLDGSATAARSLACAAWLAAEFKAKLHVLHVASQERPVHEELMRLKVPEALWPLVVLHQARGYPQDAILAAVDRYDVRLIVMTARGRTAEEPPDGESDLPKVVGHVTRAVIEQSPVPVLVLPPAYVEDLPWQRALVPVCGEAEEDVALTLAAQLGSALGFKVDVAHVADPEMGFAFESRYADALHHEYPGRFDVLIKGALAHSTLDERCSVADLAVSCGEVADELIKLIQSKHVCLLVLGWHGRFVTGRARVLKRLVQEVTCPVLFVKAAPAARFKLRVGQQEMDY